MAHCRPCRGRRWPKAVRTLRPMRICRCVMQVKVERRQCSRKRRGRCRDLRGKIRVPHNKKQRRGISRKVCWKVMLRRENLLCSSPCTVMPQHSRAARGRKRDYCRMLRMALRKQHSSRKDPVRAVLPKARGRRACRRSKTECSSRKLRIRAVLPKARGRRVCRRSKAGCSSRKVRLRAVVLRARDIRASR